MAEKNGTPEGEPTRASTRLARSRHEPAAKKGSSLVAFRRPDARPRATASASPLRSLATVAIVGGLVATIAIPAYAAIPTTPSAVTLQQAAEGDAQSIVVASNVETTALDRDSYSATTPDEIAKKKAEEAAAAAAKAAASRAAYPAVDVSMVSPGSGAVRWPVTTYHIGDWSVNGFRTAARPTHNGLDMLNSPGTPIYAAADGVVRIAQDGYYTYGNAVVIDSVINGQVVTTLYAHMIWGSRLVEAGQTVSAGQMIGQMGMTGYATTPHLHFEVKINGSYVDPWPWLNSNAG